MSILLITVGDFLIRPQKPVEADSAGSARAEPAESAWTGIQGLSPNSKIPYSNKQDGHLSTC